MSEESTTETTHDAPETPIAIGAKKSNILELLIEALLQKYSPTGTGDQMELKSTLDILDEMEPVAQLDKWQLQLALEQNGFKPRYTDAGAFWQLFKI